MKDRLEFTHKALGVWVSLWSTKNKPSAVSKPHVNRRSRTVTSRCARAACLNSMISFLSILPLQTEDTGLVCIKFQKLHYISIINLKDPGISEFSLNMLRLNLESSEIAVLPNRLWYSTTFPLSSDPHQVAHREVFERCVGIDGACWRRGQQFPQVCY